MRQQIHSTPPASASQHLKTGKKGALDEGAFSFSSPTCCMYLAETSGLDGGGGSHNAAGAAATDKTAQVSAHGG